MSGIQWPHHPRPPEVSAMAETRIKRWLRQSGAQIRPAPGEAWPIVTVAYDLGIPGVAIGRDLAKRLDFAAWNRGRVIDMARVLHLGKDGFHAPDNPSGSVIADFLFSVWSPPGEPSTDHAARIQQVIDRIGRRGSAVIVGCAARLSEVPYPALRTRLVAPVDTRVARVAARHRVSLEEARDRVTVDDRKQAGRVRRDRGHAIDDPTQYDLVVNVADFDHRRVTGLLQMGYLAKFGKLPKSGISPSPLRLSSIVYLQPPIETAGKG